MVLGHILQHNVVVKEKKVIMNLHYQSVLEKISSGFSWMSQKFLLLQLNWQIIFLIQLNKIFVLQIWILLNNAKDLPFSSPNTEVYTQPHASFIDASKEKLIPSSVCWGLFKLYQQKYIVFHSVWWTSVTP